MLTEQFKLVTECAFRQNMLHNFVVIPETDVFLTCLITLMTTLL